MTFKKNWEKASESFSLPNDVIVRMVTLAFPNKKLKSHRTIKGGCANLNIYIQYEEDMEPMVLRVYLRDQNAAFREKKIAELIYPDVPVPKVLYVGDMDGYRFSIVKFIPGILLRDLLLGAYKYDVEKVMHQAGVILAKMSEYTFSEAGFFDWKLKVVDTIDREGYIDFARQCLEDKLVLSELAPEVIAKINGCLNEYAFAFPSNAEKHLVHADFDPANILVDEINGSWRITGILDWEFSFSGSILCDVANMLRYAYQMPSAFQKGFLDGLKSRGVDLPDHWPITIIMLNLLSLLDCLRRSDSKSCPNQCADIRELINHNLAELN